MLAGSTGDPDGMLALNSNPEIRATTARIVSMPSKIEANTFYLQAYGNVLRATLRIDLPQLSCDTLNASGVEGHSLRSTWIIARGLRGVHMR
jgi:hypothetical protein